MRKMLLVSALALLTAVAVFAQNAAPAPAMVFTGALYTGTIAQSYDSATATMGLWDPANQTGSRFNFQGTYNGSGFGLYFRLREDDNWDQGNSNAKANSGSGTSNLSIPSAPGFRRLYGYIDAANGMVRIAGGRLAGYEWATGDAGGFNTLGGLDGAVGMQVQVKPMDGLNFGAFLPFTYGTSTIPDKFLTLNEAVSFLAVGAKYTVKGVGDIEGGYWGAAALNNSTTTTSTNSTGSSNFYSYPKAWFGAEYVGMPNLTAILESQYSLARIKDDNYSYLAETVMYQMDQLGLALYTEQQINSNSNLGAYLGFRPQVDYTIGMADVGMFVEFLYVTKDTGYNGSTGYSVGPFVKLTFAKNVYIKAYGEVGGGDVAGPVPGAPFVSYPGNLSTPGYQTAETAGFSPLAGNFWQAGLSFVVSF